MEHAELADSAAHRSELYWLLAELTLSPPGPVLIERLCNGLPAASGDKTSNPIVDGLLALRNALPPAGDAVVGDALAVDYTRLFSGIKPGYGLPPPHESIHRGAATPTDVFTQVLASYTEAGFPALEEAAAPPDHIGVELRFIALLCHKEMEAWRAGAADAAVRALEQQRDFLDSHLLLWAPQFWTTVKAQAQHAFYRALAALALDAMTEDRALLEEMRVEFDAA